MTNTASKHIPTIVYVEDNEGDSILLQEALRERGHETQLLVIEKGDQALHYFTVKAEARDLPPPHCILLDKYLPEVTGTELLRFIRSAKVYDGTPVYIFSSNKDYTEISKVLAVSKESFLAKPTIWDQFLDLADLLMESAEDKLLKVPVQDTESIPEVTAKDSLRAHKY
jgi:CheY-like chemotaxis protein